MLVLWDIDHTLIDGAGVSRDAYAAAFARITGKAMIELADMTGKTELVIAAETLRLHGIKPDAGTVERFTSALAEELEARSELLRIRGRRLDGARELLTALASVAGVYQSVLTGNMRRIAELKLRVFDLCAHLELDAGAYGDDAEDRIDLLPAAWARAQRRYGRAYSGADTVIVGDTLLDVATAKAGSAAVVAVATGSASEQELAAAGADTVLPDLKDTAGAVEAIVRGRTVAQ
ncbi:hypothetical protein AA958_19395 [Streptomyces sp. CNQ-509]|nr:hypothetical protein AA958_19395 [Streptomyces sp. CNQ-509]